MLIRTIHSIHSPSLAEAVRQTQKPRVRSMGAPYGAHQLVHAAALAGLPLQELGEVRCKALLAGARRRGRQTHEPRRRRALQCMQVVRAERAAQRQVVRGLPAQRRACAACRALDPEPNPGTRRSSAPNALRSARSYEAWPLSGAPAPRAGPQTLNQALMRAGRPRRTRRAAPGRMRPGRSAARLHRMQDVNPIPSLKAVARGKAWSPWLACGQLGGRSSPAPHRTRRAVLSGALGHAVHKDVCCYNPHAPAVVCADPAWHMHEQRRKTKRANVPCTLTRL